MIGPLPQPPHWTVDWDELNRRHPFLRPMRDCPQDPEYHGEGDVWVHTRMVLEALASSGRWRSLPAHERAVVWTAAVLHDVAKPACTRPGPGGRLTSAGHSRRGAIMAREILWRQGAEFALREAVAALIRYHMIPFWVMEREDSLRTLLEVSQSARCDHLSIL
ncbi:MAG: HD domain-containing protein, partial [Candidatus Eremiobacterota bacterium]